MEEKKVEIVADEGGFGHRVVKMSFPSNSHKALEQQPEEAKKVTTVISGAVVKRKKTFLRKLTDTFFGEDVDNVFSYIVQDVLVPAAKNTLSDIVSGGIEMLLFGESKSGHLRRDRDRGGRGSYTSYGGYYKSDERDSRKVPVRDASRSNRTKHDFDDIILETRGEAEDVLSHLLDLIETYGMASVADLYALVDITGSYTDEKYGWTNLSNAAVNRVRDGYLLSLPRTLPLD